jgi:phosphoribosylglycinamide formyltransferase-1
MTSFFKLGWFATGRGEGSRGILKAVCESIASGELDAEIEFVFCNRERGETEATDIFIDMVEGYGIPLVMYSYRDYREARGMPRPDPSEPLPPWRIEYDREVMKRLEGFSPDLCVLAGYMLINGPELSYKYDFLNLHPAAPEGPAGTWQQVIWYLIENGAEWQGVKMHVAIPELDVGPTATYCTFPIRGRAFDKYWEEIKGKSVEEIKQEQGTENGLFKAIREHGYIRETPLIIATLRAFSRGEVKIMPDKKVVDASGQPIDGYDLSTEIDEMVKDKLVE